MTGAVGQKRVPLDFLRQAQIPLPSLQVQRPIVAEIELQFFRLDEAVANLQRIKANLHRYERSTVESIVRGAVARHLCNGTIHDVAVLLDNMRQASQQDRARKQTRQRSLPRCEWADWVD